MQNSTHGLQRKEAKVASKKASLAQKSAADRKASLEIEAKVNNARAEEIAKRKAEEAAAKAEAEAKAKAEAEAQAQAAENARTHLPEAPAEAEAENAEAAAAE